MTPGYDCRESEDDFGVGRSTPADGSGPGTTIDAVGDVRDLCRLYGADPASVSSLTNDLLVAFWRFRVGCLAEEVDELRAASTPSDAVDALVDLVVFAVGTLVSFGVPVEEAWARVHRANMAKVRGVKPERPNPFGLPDLVKPAGWVPPDHSDLVGLVGRVYGGR